MSRKNNFSFVHMIGALMVVLGHQYVLMGYSAPTILGMDIHGLGVRIIFVISGFLVTESFMRSKNVREYLFKRMVRIYPLLVVFVFVSILAGALFTTCSFKDYFLFSKDYLFKNLLMSPKFDLPGVFSDNIYPVSVNGSLWTLPVELTCYILVIFFMLLNKLLEKKSVRVANGYYAFLCILLGVIYILRITGVLNSTLIFWGTDWANAIQVSAYFFMGSLFSKLNLKKYCNLQMAVVLCGLCMGIGGIFTRIMWIFVIPYATLSFSLTDNPLFSNVIKNNICYGVYIWSFPVQQALIQVLIIRNQMQCSPLLMFIASLIPTLLLAYISFFAVEKPISKYMAKNK